ncbi:class I SAM-dependent methyltransferase family protein [Candidatus Woesearchaeota archaeon]|nr:class I SAM-dependent methyltransferase family protein [Candidatus Woesearchaeota archaeon]
MIVLEVPLKTTEKVKKTLIAKELIDHNYKPLKDNNFFYFPLKKAVKIPNTRLIDKKLEPFQKKETSLKERLKYYLTKEELKLLKTSYDIIGSIAVIEIPPELEPKETIIAEELLKLNPSLKTVVKKKNIHHGTFRTQQTGHLAGKKNKTSIYKENGIKLKVNLDKTYFSIRLGTERKRIAKQVKVGENILVMFSGVAPYPCILAKTTKANSIVGIEINPYAHKLGQENIKLNKITNVTLINDNVKKAVPRLKLIFDRILMPLPKTADEFLSTALQASKQGTIIHFYDFLNENKFKEACAKIKDTCKKANLNCKILKTVKCGQHAPKVYRICVDFKIVNRNPTPPVTASL